MLEKVIGFLNLVYQLGDYFIKAARAYAETAQGAKEWADVQAALVEIGLADIPVSPFVTPSPTATASGEPLNDSEAQFSIEEIRAEIERQQAERAATGATIVRSPRQHSMPLGGE